MTDSLTSLFNNVAKITFGATDLPAIKGSLESRIAREAFFQLANPTDIGDRQVLSQQGLDAALWNGLQSGGGGTFENLFQVQLAGAKDMRGGPVTHAVLNHIIAYVRVMREILERHIETLKG